MTQKILGSGIQKSGATKSLTVKVIGKEKANYKTADHSTISS